MKTLGERDQVRRALLGLFGPDLPGDQPDRPVCHDENVAAVAAQTLAEIGCASRRTSRWRVRRHAAPRRSLTPPLTVIRQPVAQLAAAAVAALYRLHDAESPEAHGTGTSPAGGLMVRASCAPPARA